MNARAVNSLAGVIHAAMKTKSTAAGIAMAVDAAGLLMSPETAAELAALRADTDRLQRVAEREHKNFLDTHNALNLLREDANRVMAEHGVQAQQAELERVREQAAKFKEQRGERTRFLATVSANLERANARVAALETERHSTNEALSEAAEALRAKDTRIAELEQQLAVRTFYLADSEGAEGGPTLHTTHVAAIAWCDEVEPGEWYEDDGLWVQCDTDPDTDRPTTRGAGTVTPLTVQGDGIVAEAERIRQELVKAGAKVPVLTEVRDSQRDEIRRLQTEQGEVMKALGCDGAEEWDDVVHRARQLAARGVAPKPDVVLPAKFITDAMANVPDSLPGGERS